METFFQHSAQSKKMKMLTLVPPFGQECTTGLDMSAHSKIENKQQCKVGNYGQINVTCKITTISLTMAVLAGP